MAPFKRKAVTDERPNKKVKSTDSATKPNTQSEVLRTADPIQRKAPQKSILQQEERAFPRGGASVLTPLEHKQIKAQAERDVLFEQQTGQLPRHIDEGDSAVEGKASAPARKKQKKKKQRHEGQEKGEKSAIKIHALSYKNLTPGAVVLGCVSAITERDIALALANNITGYVPITSISETLNARIEKLLRDEENPEGPANVNEEDIELQQLFYPGQWLRATVLATSSESEDSLGKSKRHIEMSIDPRQANAGLDSETVVINSMVQASVRSVEDHGIVMDLGFPKTDVTGFISKKELGAAFKLNQVQEGQTMMCLVTGTGSNGKVLKLCPDATRFSVLSGAKDLPCIDVAPSINSIQPGSAVDILITDTVVGGVVGKVMGLLDVTADVVHSGLGFNDDHVNKKLKIGAKVKARILWTTPVDDGSRRVGVSLVNHMLALSPPLSRLHESATNKTRTQIAQFQETLPLSSIVEAKVKHVYPERGLFMTIAGHSSTTLQAFAHISQVSDGQIDSLSSTTGSYQPESTHNTRILSHNPVDNLHYVSLKQSVLDQPFLRIEDLKIGETVTGFVERLILGAKGVNGILVKLSNSINALVPQMHFSDVQLQHPERKFKEGSKVRGKILSVDAEKKYVRLTLKKSLVLESETSPIWQHYADLQPGMEGRGTIVNLLPSGAAVQFFGRVRAWLPVAEMSETYIDSPEKYFRLGQTVNVRIISVDPELQEMKVSCKASDTFNSAQQAAWSETTAGELVSGVVSAKSAESVTVELESGLKGMIRVRHLRDGSVEDAEKALNKINLGQKISNLLVLHKLERSHHLILTKKPSLVEEATSHSLIQSLDNVKEGNKVPGFVRNLTGDGAYVEFANNVVGFMPKSHVSSDRIAQPMFGLTKDESISAWIISVDLAKGRFTLSMREPEKRAITPKSVITQTPTIANSVDSSVVSIADLTLGKVTKARIASVKATQINVRLADNVQGRIDVSEAFDSWDELANKKAPLQKFKPNEILKVKILGVHDARHHRFLPISHRQSSVPVYELSAKRSRIEDDDERGFTMDSVEPGSTHLAFVNNHENDCVWVNISPNVRGRIALMDLSNDAGQLQNLSKNFPVGCALRTSVKNLDVLANRLDLVANANLLDKPLSLETISPGMILAGRVTKITERSVTVQLTDSIAAPVPLVELSDDFDQLNLVQYRKNDIVRACVLDVDLPNKRLFLSLRPSRVLSSSLPVRDAQITSYAQLKIGDRIRGFIKLVADKGVYVSLGARVDAFVRVSDLSDQYVKDWKSIFEIDQLVHGRIISVDVGGRFALISLKASQVDENYVPPVTIKDLTVGMVITGKVRKVEDFGAFIDIDRTNPRLSGLCHRSEVAEKRVEDVRKLYSEGDVVKAKVLKIDIEARKVSLGLKASYFVDEVDTISEDDSEDGNGVDVDEMDVDNNGAMNTQGGIDIRDAVDAASDSTDRSEADVAEGTGDEATVDSGLKTAGFDWNGNGLDLVDNDTTSDSEAEVTVSKKRKRNKPEIKVDLTGELDKYGPRSASDFERQLLGQPNDSALWIQYMAFQLQLSEVQKARDLAERALQTIHIRETEEKANIWIAWLNLEVEYGDDERVEEVFKQASQMQDSLEMHEKLASIFIDSGRHEKADAVFERIVANKAFRPSPDVWLNYANFLMDILKEPVRARSLLSKALQSVPTNEHRALTAKFAGLEFRSVQGDAERGRTIFEGLVSEWPKWTSGWDMFLDLERSRLTQAQDKDAKTEARDKVRALFERICSQKMKKRRAKFVFKKWLEFEEAEGNPRNIARVKALAAEYVERQRMSAEDESED